MRRRDKSSESLCVEYGSEEEPKKEERSPAELLAVPEADRTNNGQRLGRPTAVNGGVIEQRDIVLCVRVKTAGGVNVPEFGYGGNDDDEVGGGRMFIVECPLERESVFVR